jgi:hypothetical protein
LETPAITVVSTLFSLVGSFWLRSRTYWSQTVQVESIRWSELGSRSGPSAMPTLRSFGMSRRSLSSTTVGLTTLAFAAGGWAWPCPPSWSFCCCAISSSRAEARLNTGTSLRSGLAIITYT